MHPLRSHSFPLPSEGVAFIPSSCRPGPEAAISIGAMTCHSCPHKDSVARPVGKAAIPRDTREDRVYVPLQVQEPGGANIAPMRAVKRH